MADYPGQLTEEGRRALDAGAVALHIHPRNQEGRESLEADVIAAALLELRQICPGVPLEVSTAAWIEGDAARRLACVRQWSVLPDSTGLNFGEPGAVELAQMLLSQGVGIEAGLFCAEDARTLSPRDSPNRATTCRSNQS
ncbi:MAG: 3-keto-5-aminohexanoate cleavage protein [Caldilineaceae bacterium]